MSWFDSLKSFASKAASAIDTFGSKGLGSVNTFAGKALKTVEDVVKSEPAQAFLASQPELAAAVGTGLAGAKGLLGASEFAEKGLKQLEGAGILSGGRPEPPKTQPMPGAGILKSVKAGPSSGPGGAPPLVQPLPGSKMNPLAPSTSMRRPLSQDPVMLKPIPGAPAFGSRSRGPRHVNQPPLPTTPSQMVPIYGSRQQMRAEILRGVPASTIMQRSRPLGGLSRRGR